MPAPRFTEQLNLQIGNELAAHNQYLAVAVHYDAESWGAGFVASPGISLEGDGEIDYALRDPLNNPGPRLDFELNFAGGDATLRPICDLCSIEWRQNRRAL